MDSVKTKLVVLVSGSGSNLQAIIDAIDAGRLDATICAVISNRADAFAIERARRSNIPTLVVKVESGESRDAYDRRLEQQVASFTPDLIVLAGFMRILSEWFVSRFAGKILNIHPSLLPKYKGTDTHNRVLAAGESEHGATVHIVTAALDDGPIISQARVPVYESDDEESLRLRVLEKEHIIYPSAIAAYTKAL